MKKPTDWSFLVESLGNVTTTAPRPRLNGVSTLHSPLQCFRVFIASNPDLAKILASKKHKFPL